MRIAHLLARTDPVLSSSASWNMVRSGWKSSKPELKDEEEDARVKVEAEAELRGKRVDVEEVEDTVDTSSPSVFELAGTSDEEKEDILPRTLCSLIRIYTHNGTVVCFG